MKRYVVIPEAGEIYFFVVYDRQTNKIASFPGRTWHTSRLRAWRVARVLNKGGYKQSEAAE